MRVSRDAAIGECIGGANDRSSEIEPGPLYWSSDNAVKRELEREQAMSKVKEIRESADVKLTKLGARADAFQATLEKSKDHADRIEPNQQEVRRALDQLKVGIDRQKDLSDERKQAIHSLVDTLNAQMAASQTASRETLAYARQQIREASRRMETELDDTLADSKNRVDELLQTAINTYGQAVDKLDAELEAAELRFASAEKKENTALDDGRRETAQKIAALKRRLAERKGHPGERLTDFETQLRGEFEQLVKSFKDLLSK
jgi:ABC-type transporter Mla subunit MlaD